MVQPINPNADLDLRRISSRLIPMMPPPPLDQDQRFRSSSLILTLYCRLLLSRPFFRAMVILRRQGTTLIPRLEVFWACVSSVIKIVNHFEDRQNSPLTLPREPSKRVTDNESVSVPSEWSWIEMAVCVGLICRELSLRGRSWK